MASPDRLIDFYENLSLADVERLAEFYTEDAYFKDPFNEVRGIEAIQRIYRHMFKQMVTPRFRIIHRIVDPHGDVMLVWECWFHSRLLGGEQCLHGVSHVRFAMDGRIDFHRDYWDAADELYAKLPLLGGLMRVLKRSFSTSFTS
jgi:steroid delta-isomerase